ncbi:MAG TPA: BolA/IbaG family iron-sulfur metabolism protein [Alphaproteobacteria bacterium]|nr:BolA family transcriptional regulator [Alphaproteobacteria bacterium]HMS44928.1 BolA/IbaG family iron-sulfur metabolism protein [Alphaproteobacteria bacterium]
MAMTVEEITKLIKLSIPDAIIKLVDQRGDQDHYQATIHSNLFAGKSKIQQHQLVYQALKGYMGGRLHALSLTTIAITETSKK